MLIYGYRYVLLFVCGMSSLEYPCVVFVKSAEDVDPGYGVVDTAVCLYTQVMQRGSVSPNTVDSSEIGIGAPPRVTLTCA